MSVLQARHGQAFLRKKRGHECRHCFSTRHSIWCVEKMSGLIEYTPYLALLLRVWIGANLMIHGYPKLKSIFYPVKPGTAGYNIEGAKKIAQSMGAPADSAYVVTVLEFFGGLSLVIGLLVPLMGLLFTVEFASIAIAKKFKQRGRYIGGELGSRYEINILYMLFGITLIVLGAGPFSVDSLLGL